MILHSLFSLSIIKMPGFLCFISVFVCITKSHSILHFLFSSTSSRWWEYHFSPNFFSYLWCFLYWFPANCKQEQTIYVVMFRTFSFHDLHRKNTFSSSLAWVCSKSLFLWAAQIRFFWSFVLILLLLTTATFFPPSFLQFLSGMNCVTLSPTNCPAFLSFRCSLCFLSSFKLNFFMCSFLKLVKESNMHQTNTYFCDDFLWAVYFQIKCPKKYLKKKSKWQI